LHFPALPLFPWTEEEVRLIRSPFSPLVIPDPFGLFLLPVLSFQSMNNLFSNLSLGGTNLFSLPQGLSFLNLLFSPTP